MRRPLEPKGPSLFDYWDRRIAPALGEEAVKQERLRQAEAKERELRRARLDHKQQRPWSLNRQRVSEIKAVVLHRHGGPCDTDDAETYLEAALPHFVKLYTDPTALRAMVEAWACTLLPGISRERILALLEGHEDREWRPEEADEIAGRLQVTDAERTALRFVTIGAIDCDKDQRAANRKKRDAEYQAEKRARAGATPRSASNVAQAKKLGLSLSTFKRRLKAGLIVAPEITPDPISSALVRRTHLPPTNSVHPPIQAVEDPARQASPSRSVGAGGHSPRSEPRTPRQGNAVAQPLPMVGVSQPDLLPEFQTLGTALDTYLGGMMPLELVRAVRAAQRARMVTQEAVAHAIGVSRPQLANALQGRFGLSRSAAANLVRWLEAA